MKCLVLSIICILNIQNYSQEKSVTSLHPFSSAVVFTAELGSTYPFTDYSNPELDLFGRGLVEYYFPSKSIHTIGIRFLSGGGFVSGEGYAADGREINYRTSIFFLGGGFTYAVSWGNGVPYISATVSYLRFDPRDKNGNFLVNNKLRKFDPNTIMYSGELGIRFPFEELLSLNIGININLTNTDYMDDTKKGFNNDAFITAFAGLSFYIGAEKDKDKDGIEDKKDMCPETPKGLDVDEFGCPIDSDSDGIPDYLDKCIDTPRNIIVDLFGCPIDSDNDGVPDYLDKCGDTPQDVLVDENGCSKIQLADSASGKKNEKKSSPKQYIIETIKGPLRYNQSAEKLLEDDIYTDGKLYCFQLNLFQYMYDASKNADSLRQKGHSVFISKIVPFNDGKVWYGVRIGFFYSIEEALKYKEKYFK